MRRLLLVSVLAATVTSAVAVAVSASASVNPGNGLAAVETAATGPAASSLSRDVAAARLATEKYATNLSRAKAAGYRIITPMIPNMGYHYMNPGVKGFDIHKPNALVYEHVGRTWRLGALEWVFTTMPSRPPLPGARYGVFGAACHYVDGTFVFSTAKAKCAPKSPTTGAAFSFWHPRLVTLHFWIWYPNPTGIYMGMNPLVAPFNAG